MTDTRRFPILRSGETIAWSVIGPHEKQAWSNHDQTLNRLAERGGLSWMEALLVMSDKPLYPFHNDPDARNKVLKICAAAEEQSGITTDPRICIIVDRMVNGVQVQSERHISFTLWREGKFSGAVFDTEINAMMKEVSYG